MAEPVEVEEYDRGGDAAVAVGHDGPFGSDASLVDAVAKLLKRVKPALGGEKDLTWNIQGAGDMPPARASSAITGVLTLVAGVDQLQVGMAEESGKLFGSQSELGADAR